MGGGVVTRPENPAPVWGVARCTGIEHEAVSEYAARRIVENCARMPKDARFNTLPGQCTLVQWIDGEWVPAK